MLSPLSLGSPSHTPPAQKLIPEERGRETEETSSRDNASFYHSWPKPVTNVLAARYTAEVEHNCSTYVEVYVGLRVSAYWRSSGDLSPPSSGWFPARIVRVYRSRRPAPYPNHFRNISHCVVLFHTGPLTNARRKLPLSHIAPQDTNRNAGSPPEYLDQPSGLC